MGIVISTTTLSPFSLATGVIGLVSFAFTVSTFLRVVWVNLSTMAEAPHEVHAYLTNLRTELLEEKGSIRAMRKQARRNHRAARRGECADTPPGLGLDDVSLKTMGDTVKSLIRQFKEVERPFLEDGAEGVEDEWRHVVRDNGRRKRDGSDGSRSPYYTHEAYASPREKGGDLERGRRERERERDREDDDDEDAFWAQRTQYASFTLGKRMAWVRKKGDAQRLFETLSRVQIRRIARQVGGVSLLMHEYGGGVMRSQEILRRLDERMNTIVGVRRVD